MFDEKEFSQEELLSYMLSEAELQDYEPETAFIADILQLMG